MALTLHWEEKEAEGIFTSLTLVSTFELLNELIKLKIQNVPIFTLK